MRQITLQIHKCKYQWLLFFVIISSCKIHSNEEIINLSKNFYLEKQKQLNEIVNLINSKDCGVDSFVIIYHGKYHEVDTRNSNTKYFFDCFDQNQEELLLRIFSGNKVRGIEVRKRKSISFGLQFKRKPFLHSGIIYFYNNENLEELGMHFVSKGQLPEVQDNWIYPIDEHWFVYVPKEKE